MEAEKKRKKRDLPEEQVSYVAGIKKLLNNALSNSHMNIAELGITLEKRYNFNINQGTLRKLFDISSPNMDYACLVTVFDYFKLDFTLLSPPSSDSMETGIPTSSFHASTRDPFTASVSSVKNRFPVLKNEAYTGDFIGIFMSPTFSEVRETNEKLHCFELSLQKSADGTIEAIAKKYPSFPIEDRSNCTIFRGVPVLSKAYKCILLFLTEENLGEFYLLSFGFQQYRTGARLDFRQGIALTGETLNGGVLLAQSFVLLDRLPSANEMIYIRGMLKAPNPDICITAEKMEELAQIHPDVQQFIEHLQDKLVKKDTYVIQEKNIMSADCEKLTSVERMKVLTLLKTHSTVGDKFYYRPKSILSDFARQYLYKRK